LGRTGGDLEVIRIQRHVGDERLAQLAELTEFEVVKMVKTESTILHFVVNDFLWDIEIRRSFAHQKLLSHDNLTNVRATIQKLQMPRTSNSHNHRCFFLSFELE
jgi:hypothetical protein